MSLTVGTRLGIYEILAPLGAGGMGEVYRARDPRLGRDVAVKVLPAAVASHPDRLARFEREARTVAALNHPNIVTLYSIEDTGGTRFLTMELVDGQSLAALVTPAGLPLARVLELVIPLADALVAAHEKGVVHRDLKPANVMVTREGRVKVLDFGLAKLAQAESDPQLTQAMTMESPVSAVGTVVGTAQYMAPEQLRGEAVDARTDLFSLGILLHELACGRRPFGGETIADVTSSILRDAPAPLASARGDLPRDLERIVARCLEKRPQDRFQTARDVHNELRYLSREAERAHGTPPSTASALPGSSPTAAGKGAQSSAGAAQHAASIAVLPFVNRSRDEADEYFSDGLADELLSVLARIRGLRVAARTSSSTFKGKSVTIEEVGRALNVDCVLEGSVRKSGNRVRIAVQLVKVADGYPLWSESYDRTLEDVFAVQDDIAQSVVKELRTALLGEAPDSKGSGEVKAEVAAAARERAENPEAHRLYLQGRHLIDRLTAEDTHTGIALLKRSLQLDPAQALAWVHLAHAHTNVAGYGWGPLEDGYAQAREAVARALALAPNLAEAHAMQGRILTSFDWDWQAAEACYGRALDLAPMSAEVLIGASVAASHRGRTDDAVRLSRSAVELDPLSSTCYGRFGFACRAAGLLGEAEVAIRKSLELSPQRIVSHLMLSALHREQGRLNEALVEAELEPAPWARLLAVAVASHSAGRAEQAQAALRELEQHHAVDSAYQIAAAHAAMGHADAAFDWLDRAFAERDGGLPFARTESLFRGLHADPRWKAHLKRMHQDD